MVKVLEISFGIFRLWHRITALQALKANDSATARDDASIILT